MDTLNYKEAVDMIKSSFPEYRSSPHNRLYYILKKYHIQYEADKGEMIINKPQFEEAIQEALKVARPHKKVHSSKEAKPLASPILVAAGKHVMKNIIEDRRIHAFEPSHAVPKAQEQTPEDRAWKTMYESLDPIVKRAIQKARETTNEPIANIIAKIVNKKVLDSIKIDLDI